MDGLLLALGVVRVDHGRGRVTGGLTTADCRDGGRRAHLSSGRGNARGHRFGYGVRTALAAAHRHLGQVHARLWRHRRDEGERGSDEQHHGVEMLENPIWSYSSSFDYLRGEA